MTTRSREETEADNIRVMGAEMGTAFSALDHNVIELHVLWKQYRELFCNDSEVVALLNSTAGLLFKVVQDALWDSVLLRILRLTDGAKTGSKPNLTLKTLETLETLIPESEPGFKEAVVKLVETAREKSNGAREHRNQRIAHQDYNYGMNRDSYFLDDINVAMVEEMLAAIRAVMHCFEVHFNMSQTIYENFIDETGARLFAAKLKHFESLDSASRNS